MPEVGEFVRIVKLADKTELALDMEASSARYTVPFVTQKLA